MCEITTFTVQKMDSKANNYIKESCQLCNAPNPSLQHILSSCKTALTQGRYRWRHDRVLRKLAEILEVRRAETARERLSQTSRRPIHFVREGGGAPIHQRSPQDPALSRQFEWILRVDLDRQLRFPTEITTTNLRPDIILWSATAQTTVILAELTVPWEGGMGAAFERKKDRYLDLTAECREAGWAAVSYPVEVGCRGFVGASTQRFLKNMGVTGPKLRKALKDLAEEAEQGSFWLWLRRKDQVWGKQGNINEGWLPADDPAATRNGTVGGAASRNAQQAVTCLCYHH
ncbi:uncharacterized protein LOC118335673 [Morone saxatilis]|uniref:uncharacterized protein LOC118335673 n=1 Tax=Morone saxatilis TaxID=34816 RepID=UPI0015E25461|nr:uncharacterized protein LOC118335673 [Morone saxatilis]